MKSLFIIPLVLMSLVSFPSSSVLAKEYVMSCSNNEVFKIVDNPMNKKLYARKMGEWKERCTGEFETLKHNGDGAVCITKVKDGVDRCKKGTFGGCILDKTEVYDFFLYTYSWTIPNDDGNDLKRKFSCKKVE